MAHSGTLTVVGTGIRFVRQVTAQARFSIEGAQHVLHLVDAATAEWIAKLNPSAESLQFHFQTGKSRTQSYSGIVEHILSRVREERIVCVAFYGHPGFFLSASHDAIRRAREEGFNARMLPGVSAQDCLFADLGIDPGRSGCQSFDAESFVLFKRVFDPSSPLILWQADLVDLNRLRDVLLEHYDDGHNVILYEAPVSPARNPVAGALPLRDLARIQSFSTIFVPASQAPDQDPEMYARLGLRQI